MFKRNPQIQAESGLDKSSLQGTARVSSEAVPWIDRNQPEIQQLLDAGLREPLAHALWHEASQQQDTSPRSAILIGIAALEVGIKHYAIKCVPDSAWLLEEAPAPPVHRMLTEFLPGLPPVAGGKGFEVPSKETLETIRKGVRVRNEVTHKGVTRLKPEIVRSVLSSVRALLWQLDAGAGAEWAEQYADEDNSGF